MVYEDSRAEGKEQRFHIELLFSPGLYPCFLTEKERIYENRMNKFVVLNFHFLASSFSKSMSKSHSREGGSSPNTHGNGEAREVPTTLAFPVLPDELSISSASEEKLSASKVAG